MEQGEPLAPSASHTSLKTIWVDDEGIVGLSDLEVVRDGDCIIVREQKFKREGPCHRLNELNTISSHFMYKRYEIQ